MKITIRDVYIGTTGNYTLTDMQGREFWLSSKQNFVPAKGQSVDIEFIEKKGVGGQKDYLAIVKIRHATDTPQNGGCCNTPPQKSEKDIYFENKLAMDKATNNAMIKMSALKASAQMVQANAEVLACCNLCKEMTKEQVQAWLDSLRKTYYADFLMALGGDVEIPF